MAIPAQTWYVGSTKWTAVAPWAATTVYAAGGVVRQLATPTVGNERVFACIVAGTSLGSEPTWSITKGAKTVESGGPTWIELTGRAGVNGDLTNTSNWTAVKNVGVALGQLIQRNSGGSLQVCTTAGNTGNGAEPAFSNTAGVTTNDGTVVWTSLGAPGGFGAYAAPMARLNLVLATGLFITSGDTVYVSNNHAETQSSAIAYGAGLSSTGVPTPIYCVSDTVAPPTTLATTATVTTTGANNLVVGSAIYVYGITFSAGDGASNAILNISDTGSSAPTILEKCTLKLGTTSTTTTSIAQGNIAGTSASGLLNLIDCTTVFGATGQTLKVGGWMTVRNLTIGATGSVPTTAFTLENAGIITIEDSDLSNLTGTLFGGGGSLNMFNVFVNNCKLNASAVLVNAVPTGLSGPKVRLHNSDSANTNYNYNYSAKGAVVTSETSIVRTSGASNGTTPISWKFVSAATPTFAFPFVSEEIGQWQNNTGSALTATVEVTTSSALTNADLWLEIEYLGDASSPKGSTVNTRAVPLVSPVALTTSSASWGGAVQTFKYLLSVSFTPQKKGPLYGRIYLAKPSVTVYVDPFITVA